MNSDFFHFFPSFYHLYYYFTSRENRQLMSVRYAMQVNGHCIEDNPDALTHQEALLPGHLLLKFMREQLEVCLQTLKMQVQKDMDASCLVNLHDESYIRRIIDHWPDIVR